jgi:hypothetical protein
MSGGRVAGQLSGFLRRNVVLIVCVPSLALIHYGWYRLQFNDDFIDPADRKRVNIFGQPIDLKTMSFVKKD